MQKKKGLPVLANGDLLKTKGGNTEQPLLCMKEAVDGFMPAERKNCAQLKQTNTKKQRVLNIRQWA